MTNININKNMKNLLEKITIDYNLSELQKNQYKLYINFLLEENKKYNLTNIKNEIDILYYHVLDSLIVTKTVLLDNKTVFADVGSGCGVPGIIMAIFYPNKIFYLLEVVHKKINFLSQVIKILNLTNCFVSSYDFLTFIRKKNLLIDVFTARASLALKEIIKIYQFNFYDKSEVIYWGSLKWNLDPKHNVILNNKLIKINIFPYEIKNNNDIKKLNYINIKKIN